MSGLPRNPRTDSNGYYSDTVSYGWSGTVTPIKPGYTFNPSSRTYTNVTSNQSDQNYTGTLISPVALLALPDTTAATRDTIALPIYVSTDSVINLAQFVVEYDSTVIKFVDAQIGPDAFGFTSILKNSNLPFTPTFTGANKNVLIQISGGSFTGPKRKVVILKFQVIDTVGNQTPLAFDQNPSHTFLTTANLVDLKGDLLAFQNGKLTVTINRFAVFGKVLYCSTSTRPVPSVFLNLVHPEGTAKDTSDASGSYGFSNILQGSCRLTPSKNGDQRGAITGADALKVLRVLAFLEPPLTGCAFTAADVTKDGRITGADALAILRYLAFFTTNIGSTGQWAFTPPDTSFTLSANTTVNFSAVLLGDVNLSWTSGVTTSLLAMRKSETGESDQTMPASPASKATLKLSTNTESYALGDTVVVSITVSTDSVIAIAQFVVDYDSTVIQYQNAQVGSHTAGYSLLVNPNLPFSTSSQGTNKNVLVQITSPDPSTGFKGADQQVAILKFVGKAKGTSPLVFDPDPSRTFLTTLNLTDLRGSDLTFVSLQVTVPVHSPVEPPKEYRLFQNYPNPFNPSTTIRYEIPVRSHVLLSVYDVLGRKVATLVDEVKEAGRYEVLWNPSQDLPSGVYFYVLQAGSFIDTKKLVLLK
jgi:hypothetical protein